MIASYLTTLSTRGKKPSTIAVEKYYGQWWTDRLTGKALHAVTLALRDQAMVNLAGKHYAAEPLVHYMKFLRHVFRWAIGQPNDAWIRLAILTGLRKSEKFGVRWADIDLERGVITLPHTKSETVQYVHLTEGAKAIMGSLIAGNASVWVFQSENPDTHLDHHNFYARLYQPTLVTAKLPRVTWHTLRHTVASRLAMNGQAPSTIAALLRHSGTDLVARYAHLSPPHLQGALEGVSGFGKVTKAMTQTGPELRHEGENSNPTVAGTGMEN